MSKISFNYTGRPFRINHKRKIKSFIEHIFVKEKVPLMHLDYIFCTDEYLLQINRDFLKHDFYTDIISFNLGEPGVAITGEVYISTERVKENAALLKTKQEDEALRVIFHGALHLCGYNDKKKDDITLMRKKEDDYIRLFKKPS